MNAVDHVVRLARERLDAIVAERAALDAEERKLRQILEAADAAPPPAAQPSAPVVPWFPVPWPVVPVQPHPMTPWQPRPFDLPATPIWAGHGGLCACPQCVMQMICVADVSAQPTSLEVFVGETRPDWDLILRSNGVRFDRPIHVGGPPGFNQHGGQRYTVS